MIAPAGRAQDAWPSKPVRVVLPYTGGGSADALARAIAEQLKTAFGQSFIVETPPRCHPKPSAR